MSGHAQGHADEDSEVCVNCQLVRALTEWRDSGAPVDDVVEAITDIVHNIVHSVLDEIFADEAPGARLDG